MCYIRQVLDLNALTGWRYASIALLLSKMSPSAASGGTSMSATHRQFLKYAVVGVASNVAVYIVYLLLAATIFEPKIAMTISYALGVFLSYLFNRRWTFKYRGARGYSLMRYVMAYGFGYMINLSALLIFVDYLHLAHEIVQGCMVFAVAIVLFLLQKYWVFRAATEHNAPRIDKVSSVGNPP